MRFGIMLQGRKR